MALLSDGQNVEVRRLKFLEVEDNVLYPIEPPYTHTYQTAAGEQEIQYVLSDWDKPPEKPKQSFSKAKPDTELFAQWESYNLYQAVLLHEQRRADQTQKYLLSVARYVKNNCIPAKDKKRIVTPADYEAISQEALCPEVTMEDIEAELASTFQGLMGKFAGFNSIGANQAGLGKIS